MGEAWAVVGVWAVRLLGGESGGMGEAWAARVVGGGGGVSGEGAGGRMNHPRKLMSGGASIAGKRVCTCGPQA